MMNERLRRYGATLATATALGGVMVASAEAKPMGSAAPAGIENVNKEPLPQTSPEGVRTISVGIQQEAQEAVSRIHKRWDGVLVLHAPKKNAYVGFASSPYSYASENADLFVLGKETTQQVIIPRPAIERFKGRDFAVVYDTMTSNWAFLDVKFAQDMGALSSYAFKGKRARAENYPIEEQQADMPVIYDWRGYGADWVGQHYHQTLSALWLPVNTDPTRKRYHVTPTSVMPHS